MKYLLLVVSIFGLDEGIKQRIDKKEPLGKERRVPKLPVVIEKYYNNGAALNLLAKKPKIMLGLHSACMAGLMTIYGFVLRRGTTGLKTGMSMMVGGGLSNLWDRIHKKHVVDYIRFDTPWKRFSRIVFNISDFFIFIGAAVSMLFAYRYENGIAANGSNTEGSNPIFLNQIRSLYLNQHKKSLLKIKFYI